MKCSRTEFLPRSRKNNSFFAANNFVNSVLANVIIKIKENYINAMLSVCDCAVLYALCADKSQQENFKKEINFFHRNSTRSHIVFNSTSHANRGLIIILIRTGYCFGCLLNNNRNERNDGWRGGNEEEKSHVVTSALSNPFKSQKTREKCECVRKSSRMLRG